MSGPVRTAHQAELLDRVSRWVNINAVDSNRGRAEKTQLYCQRYILNVYFRDVSADTFFSDRQEQTFHRSIPIWAVAERKQLNLQGHFCRLIRLRQAPINVQATTTTAMCFQVSNGKLVRVSAPPMQGHLRRRFGVAEGPSSKRRRVRRPARSRTAT
jgi:hypothetical protein